MASWKDVWARANFCAAVESYYTSTKEILWTDGTKTRPLNADSAMEQMDAREAPTTHGGRREGAGPKPMPEGTKKVPYGTRLDPVTIEYLQSCENAAETITGAVKGTPEYQDWAAATRP